MRLDPNVKGAKVNYPLRTGLPGSSPSPTVEDERDRSKLGSLLC
ncbi:hypothetical protein MJ1HA_2467 [Metallosphaera sedula]|nr:hypothetical protein MJ1HA_2467 [Metallosphaera sedula]